MISVIKKTTCALAILAATSGAVMADSVDVKVIGSIQPSACKPSLAGGGTLDYGVISPDSLKADDITILEKKEVPFSITCSAPTKVAMVAKTGRPGTLTDPRSGKLVDSAFVLGIDGAFGLGLAGGKAIGGFGLKIEPGSVTADGQEARTVFTFSLGDSWARSAVGSFVGYPGAEKIISWAGPLNTDPISFTVLNATLSSKSFINKTSELDLSKPIQLDGLATLELIYL